MVVTEMPIKDFLDFVIETAHKLKYSSVLLFLSRTAENKTFQKSIHEDWSSLDDLSNSKMMIVIPRNKPHRERTKGAIKVMWNEVYNNQLQLIETIDYPYGYHENGHRLAAEISDRYKKEKERKYRHFDENPMRLKELQKNLTLNTAEISDYFGISEDWIPCTIFLSLKTKSIYAIKLPIELSLYTFLKNMFLRNRKIDEYIDFFNTENVIFHKKSNLILDNKKLRDWNISFLNQDETKIISDISKEKNSFRHLLENKNLDDFFTKINSFLSSIPYVLFKNINENEAFYHIILQMILQTGIGFKEIKSEENTSLGRSDLVIILENIIYILELKYSKKDKKLGETALQQIEEKQYHTKYLFLKKEIVFVGVVFSSKNKNINEWTYKVLKTNEDEI